MRIRNAIDLLPPAHRIPSSDGEVVTGPEKSKLRLQDYAFTQGFCLVVVSYDKKQQRLIIECLRYKKKTRNTQKIEEKDRVRAATDVAYNNCRYRVKMTYIKDDGQWKITVLESKHNHLMAPDPFAFPQYRDRDPSHEKAMQLGLSLVESNAKFRQAKQTLQAQGLNMDTKTYYNLIRSTGKKTSEEQLSLALRTLELEGFHVRCLKKYVVENRVRKQQVIDHFFFCNPKQIQYARRFVSGFAVQTDATFNTNHLNMPLSSLVGTTNTAKTFTMAYCFVTSKSTEAFSFINWCVQDLIFYDNCPGPAVMIGDFSAGLSSAMVHKQDMTMSEAGMEVAWRMEQELDSVGSKVKLQLCFWHAAEAVKKQLITEGYPKTLRPELEDLIWKWISAPTMMELDNQRAALMERLCPKEAEYLLDYYGPKEHQFIYAYTRLLPNLGAKSSQRVESSHNMVKHITNRYTPIQKGVKKIIQEVNGMFDDRESLINNQRRNVPRLMDRKWFNEVRVFYNYITRYNINMFLDRESDHLPSN